LDVKKIKAETKTTVALRKPRPKYATGTSKRVLNKGVHNLYMGIKMHSRGFEVLYYTTGTRKLLE
jgi:hypothetical protein